MKRIAFFLLLLAVLLAACSEKKTRYMAPVLEKGKWGYVDESGNYLIDPQFDFADVFYNGTSIVKTKGKFGIIDKSGNLLCSDFDSLIRISPDYFFARKLSLYGVIDAQGKFSLEPQFVNVAPYPFSDSLYQGLLSNNKICIVSPRGKLLNTGVLSACSEFEKGLAVFTVETDAADSVTKEMQLFGHKPVKSGLIDRKGNVLVEAQQYDNIMFRERAGCYVSFKVKQVTVEDLFGNFGLIDTTGKIIADAIYEDEPVYGDGMFAVRLNGKYGYTDRSGKMIISPQFDFAMPFGEGLAVAGVDKTPYLIDKSGKRIAPMPFMQGSFPFHSGRAGYLSEARKIGFIDREGKIVVEAKYDIATDYFEGCAVVQKDSLSGLIDKNGKELLPVKYLHIERLRKNIYQVVTAERKIGIADSTGKFILQPVNDDVFAYDDATITTVNGNLYASYNDNGQVIHAATSRRPVYFFDRNYAVADEGGKFGIIDRSGKALLPMTNDSIGIFIKGHAVLVSNGHSGLVDSTGKILVQPTYDELMIAPNGFGRIRQGDKYGFIDWAGNVLCEPRFEDAGPLTDPDKKY